MSCAVGNCGKVALVTGASRGIGAAVARVLAQRGYAVLVNYRSRAAEAATVVKQIEAAGGQAFAFAADVGAEHEVMAMFQTLEQRWNRLDVLVNNAGILERQCRVQDLTLERLQRLFSANVFGTFLCTREALKRMGRGASIVNVSSVAARLGAAGEYVDYAATKGAMDTLTIGLAREVAERGIRVNSVRPGYIYTEIHADGGEPERVDRVAAGLPLKRGGYPEEVAQAVAWLVSDEASYTTGTFIEVAGGR